MGVGVQLCFQASLYRWPLRIDDAEINGMPDAPAGRNHVVSKDAFFPRPDAQDRCPRALI